MRTRDVEHGRQTNYVVTVNALLLVLNMCLLLPLAVMFAPALSGDCISSSEEAQRAFALWAIAVVFVTPLVLRYVAVMTVKNVGLGVLVHLLAVGMTTVALPNLDFGSLDRWRQKRTVADMQAIASELQLLRERFGAFPALTSVHQLRQITRVRLSETDGWGNSFLLTSSGPSYVLTSRGLCGQSDAAGDPAHSADPRGDIVIVNNRFVRSPLWHASQ